MTDLRYGHKIDATEAREFAIKELSITVLSMALSAIINEMSYELKLCIR